MRSHRRPNPTNRPPSPPSDTISRHLSSCATPTPRYGPSNDLKTGNISKKKLGKSHRLVKDVNTFPDNVLLQVFDFYRMCPEALFPPRIETTWKWHELAHVCWRWRRAIFGSPRRLDLQLICTHGMPVRKNLGCWPAFPISIDFYSDISFGGTVDPLGLEDEDNVVAALEHPDRVRCVRLTLTPSQLRRLSTAMLEPLLALTTLQLRSINGNAPILPDAFLGGYAPRLQNIHFAGIPFPALPTLLSSASNLVELQLVQIPKTGYISPRAMVASLAALAKLETLCIVFQSPTSRPSPRYPPPLTRTVLLALTQFRFRGVSEYLEDFVAQIDTPRLKYFKIRFFNQLDFRVPQLSQFLRRQEILNPAQLYNARLEFSRRGTGTELTSSHRPLSPCSPVEGPFLDIYILSEGLDWQASHLTQVLGQFSELSDVGHLFIDDGISGPDQRDGMYDAEWLELLSLFACVKSLIISHDKAGYITRALGGTTGEMIAETLPALRLLHVSPKDRSAASIEQFVSLRRLSSRPITIVDTQQEFDRLRPLLTKEEKVPLT